MQTSLVSKSRSEVASGWWVLRRELEEVGGVDDKEHEDTLDVTVIDVCCLDCGDGFIGAHVC